MNKILKGTKNLIYSKAFFVMIMLFPMLFHLAVFWLGVQIESIKLAFVDEMGNFTWDYFKLVFQQFASSGDSVGIFFISLRNTLIFWLISTCQIPLVIFFAYMFYKEMWGHKVARVIFYLPGLFGSLMMAIIIQQMFMSDGFMIRFLNDVLHLNVPTPLIMEAAMEFIASFDIWFGVGSGMIIWMGAMGRIPYDLIEVGWLDGIKPGREFFSVIIPLIRPTLTTFLTLQVVGILGASGSVLLFTEGKYDTWTLSYYLYHIVYKGQTQSYHDASALGLLMTLVTIPLVVLSRLIINKWGEEVQY